jgi:hypothetical protein
LASSIPVEELVQLARAQPNPFAASVVRSGFEPPEGDVPEIHAAQRAQLAALVEEVRRSGKLALQVITGEPGDGKTHLLSFLRSQAERSWTQPGSELAMVPIEPLRDPSAPFLHILQNLVRGLRRPLSLVEPGDGAAQTPLERILWRILRGAVERSSAPDCVAIGPGPKRFPTAAALHLREHWSALSAALRDEAPQGADADVWAVLCRFPEHPQLVMRWLGGASLPDEELQPLGARAPLEGEARAYQALATLLSLSPVPIVLGFDQLEGVARLGDKAITGLLQALGDQLFSAGGRAVVLLFCQAETWHNYVSKVQEQTQARFRQRGQLNLDQLSPEVAERLVCERLAAMWRGLGAVPPHPTFPFPEGLVRAEIVKEQLRSPRRVLDWFARRGFVEETRPPPPTPRALALTAFEKLRREAPEREDREAAEVVLAGLATLMKGASSRMIGDTAVVAARRTEKGLQVRLARKGKETAVYAEVSNQRQGPWAKGVETRFKEALAKADRALLLRSEALTLPPQATKVLEGLGPKAALVRLDKEAHKDLSAVEGLVNGAASGDLDVSLEVATKVLADEIAPRLAVVRAFLAQSLAAPAKEAPQPPAPKGSQLEAKVLAAVEKPPYLIEEASLAKGLAIAPEELAVAADALAKLGRLSVQEGKDGARTLLRRPR